MQLLGSLFIVYTPILPSSYATIFCINLNLVEEAVFVTSWLPLHKKDWIGCSPISQAPPSKLPQNQGRICVAAGKSRDKNSYFEGDEERHGFPYNENLLMSFCVHFQKFIYEQEFYICSDLLISVIFL